MYPPSSILVLLSHGRWYFVFWVAGETKNCWILKSLPRESFSIAAAPRTNLAELWNMYVSVWVKRRIARYLRGLTYPGWTRKEIKSFFLLHAHAVKHTFNKTRKTGLTSFPPCLRFPENDAQYTRSARVRTGCVRNIRRSRIAVGHGSRLFLPVYPFSRSEKFFATTVYTHGRT